ncbi:MAG: tRNA 2-thiouridine(34) synthase MnmA, partial [Chlamydiia bacterium]|nr:tRNA 2-thiouridine(34) synthase MnmA [Chlamydiia bacterium]
MSISPLPSAKTVVVGMSGGVDSSVSAALLQEMGYNVIGIFMKNWEETDANGVCSTQADYEDVIRVCDQLKIPHYAINFAADYRKEVFDSFLEELKKGRTPNPDILCNKEIKFKRLLDAALKLGASALATGHYAQNIIQDGLHTLVKGADPTKDQTYFLYTMNQSILQKVLFPIGHLPKKEVRELARKFNLATSEKKDSTGICFIGERNFRSFLSNYLPYTPGNLETLAGVVVGRHEGIAYYTIGQRRGLGLGGEGEAWFVIDKDVKRNVVIVDRGEKHPALFADTLIAKDPTWVAGNPPTLPFQCSAKIRYRQPDQECTIEKMEGNLLHVSFMVPQRAITLE